MIFFAPAPPRRVTTKNQKIVGVLNTLFSRRILWPEQSVARHPPAVVVDTKYIGSAVGGVAGVRAGGRPRCHQKRTKMARFGVIKHPMLTHQLASLPIGSLRSRAQGLSII